MEGDGKENKKTSDTELQDTSTFWSGKEDEQSIAEAEGDIREQEKNDKGGENQERIVNMVT